MQIIGAYTKEFSEARNRLIHGKFNGAYYYAKEIEENISNATKALADYKESIEKGPKSDAYLKLLKNITD